MLFLGDFKKRVSLKKTQVKKTVNNGGKQGQYEATDYKKAVHSAENPKGSRTWVEDWHHKPSPGLNPDGDGLIFIRGYNFGLRFTDEL